MNKDNSFEGLFKAKLRDNGTEFSEDDYKRFCLQLEKSFSKGNLDLSGQRIGINVLTKLTKVIRANPHIRSFNFYGNLIRDHGIHSLLQLLLVNPQVTVLDIGCNDFSNQAAPCIIDIIRGTHIKSLQLGTTGIAWHNNKFSVQTLAEIVKAVGESKRIVNLGLSGLNMSVRIGSKRISMNEEISSFIRNDDVIQSLSLASCGFLPKEEEIIIEGLLSNERLKFLDFHDNPLSDPIGINFTSNLFMMTRLSYLNISQCQLSSKAGVALADSIMRHPNLVILDISNNNISDEGFSAISQVLRANFYLTELNISNNGITSVVADDIHQLLIENDILCYIDFSKNPISDQGAFSVSEAIKRNQSLTKLNISSCRITDNGAIAISQSLSSNTTIKSIKLGDNFITRDAGYSILENIRSNEYLFSIDVAATQVDHFVMKAIRDLCKRNINIQKEKELQPLKKQIVQLSIQRTKMPEAQMRLKTLSEYQQKIEKDVAETDNKISDLEQNSNRMISELRKTIVTTKEMIVEEQKAIENNIEERQKIINVHEAKHKESITCLEREKALIEYYNREVSNIGQDMMNIKKESEQENTRIMKQINELKHMLLDVQSKAKDPEQLKSFSAPPIESFGLNKNEPVFLVDRIDQIKKEEESLKKKTQKTETRPKSSRRKIPQK